ncbi:hypothetical protein [Dyella sp.]|uniref:hypothetical protein n=1 Tax=Dyella sp. TaxID=1869338 RepID=UPI002ED2307D
MTKMGKLALCSTVLLACSGSAWAQDWSPYWAIGAQGFHAGDSAQHDSVYTIKAPDAQSSLRDGEGKLELLVHDKPVANLSDYAGALNLIEASWSSDSQAVFVNTSDGGDGGTWTTHVFVLENGAAREIPVATAVSSATKIKSDCIHNLGSSAWLEGHSQLLVIEQVPAGGCGSGGATAGYVLDVAGNKVTRTLSAKELKSDYAKYVGASPIANMSTVAEKPAPKKGKAKPKAKGEDKEKSSDA